MRKFIKSPAASPAIAYREAILAGCGAIAFASAFAWVLIAHPHKLGAVWDWDFSGQLDWVSAYTITHFHQLPLWNPYKCGGMPMLANPQSRVLAPLFVLQLLFGHALGLHLEILLLIAIGWIGGYWLARMLGLSPIAAVLCASIYPGSSWLSLHLAVGHLLFLTALYLPWIAALAWYSMTRNSVGAAALAGLLIAFTLFGGGVYQVTQAAMVVGLIAAVLSIQHRSARPLLMLIALGAFSVGFSAIKLAPAYMMMLKHPRPVDTSEITPLATILEAILSRNQEMARGVEGWGFFEMGAYISVIGAALMVVGMASAPGRAAPWLVIAAVTFTLSIGDFGAYSPWDLIHHLPVFTEVRISPRFLIAFALAASVLAAFGIDFIAHHQSPAGMTAAVILAGVAILDLWDVNRPNLHYYVEAEVPPLSEVSSFHQVNDPSNHVMLPMARANTGAINCYEYTDFPTRVTGSNQPGYRGEQYLLGPGTVSLLKWTPNALSYRVAASGPTVLVVNQTWDDGWRLAAGTGEVFSYNGLLAARIPAGAQLVNLVYRDKYLGIGAVVTLLTALAAAFIGMGILPLRSLARFSPASGEIERAASSGAEPQ